MQRKPAGMTVHYIQHPAMSHHHHSSPRKAISNSGKSRHHPGYELLRILAAGNYTIRIKCPITGIDFRVQSLRFSTDKCLQYAEIALPETWIKNNLMMSTGGNALCGFMRATQITTVKRGKGFAHQPLRQGVSLGDTGSAERTIEMPLDTALPVPHGFAMAKQNDAACSH